MSRATLLDIAKRNGSDPVAGLIDETVRSHPELIFVPARTIRGQQYKTLVRTTLPTVDFRNANEGVASTKSVYENRLVETYILNPRWECDKAVADRSEDGPEAFIYDEALGQLEAGMQRICKNFFYGRNTTYGGGAKGFPGLLDSYDSTNMVVDAGGTTATTGSSCWAVKFGRKDVTWVWGQNGELEMADPRIESVLDASNNPFTAYVQELLAYPGMQVGSTYSIGRIKKLTADSGKGLTDDLIALLMAKFPVGMQPDILFCSRRSLAQLQASRTAYNPTGAAAAWPSTVETMDGRMVPIRATEAISDVEALTL